MNLANKSFFGKRLNEGGTRDSSAQTPSRLQLASIAEDLDPVVEASSGRSPVDDALQLIPKECSLLCGCLPQLKQREGREVVLVLGFCKCPDPGT